MDKKVKRNLIDRFIDEHHYERAFESENPDEKCKNCTALFTFKGKTRCYVYEQQKLKDIDLEFHPRRDYNCTMFEKTHSFANQINAILNAFRKGISPEKSDEYNEILKEENTLFKSSQHIYKEQSKDNDWDDPNSYAHCSDWEDEPENCNRCGDDECPMNKG